MVQAPTGLDMVRLTWFVFFGGPPKIVVLLLTVKKTTKDAGHNNDTKRGVGTLLRASLSLALGERLCPKKGFGAPGALNSSGRGA